MYSMFCIHWYDAQNTFLAQIVFYKNRRIIVRTPSTGTLRLKHSVIRIYVMNIQFCKFKTYIISTNDEEEHVYNFSTPLLVEIVVEFSSRFYLMESKHELG